nr:hypothetical protein [Methylorubrum extorquens]
MKPASGAISGLAKRVFLTSTPSHRNTYGLFDGCWASDLSELVPDLIRVLGHHGLTETTTPTSGTARP